MFSLYRNRNGESFENYSTIPTKNGETFKQGEALVIVGGSLTKCEATKKPTHISGGDYVSPTANGLMPVYPIFESHELETEFSEVPTVSIGDKVTLSSDGLFVTSTTAGGVAEIVLIDGNKAVVKF